MYVGRCRDSRVNESGFAVDADMRLHAEIPLVALLRLPHFRIAFFLLVLGGTRCVMMLASTMVPRTPSSIFLEVLVRQMKQLISRVVLLHQMAELANRSFVRAGSHYPDRYPANCRSMEESYSASSAAGSERLNQCCEEKSSAFAPIPTGTSGLQASWVKQQEWPPKSFRVIHCISFLEHCFAGFLRYFKAAL